jgi:hypothetical protein
MVSGPRCGISFPPILQLTADTAWPSYENGLQFVARRYCGVATPELPLLGLHWRIHSHVAPEPAHRAYRVECPVAGRTLPWLLCNRFLGRLPRS